MNFHLVKYLLSCLYLIWTLFKYNNSHEAPNDPEDPLSNQNIKDRFYGYNDPVAEKLVKRYQETTKEEKIKAKYSYFLIMEPFFEPSSH